MLLDVTVARIVWQRELGIGGPALGCHIPACGAWLCPPTAPMSPREPQTWSPRQGEEQEMGKEELPPPSILTGPWTSGRELSAGEACRRTAIPRKCHQAALTIHIHIWRRSRDWLEAFPQFRAQKVHSSTGLGTKVITQAMFPAEIMK